MAAPAAAPQTRPANPWTPHERDVLAEADNSLRRGKQLYQWFLNTGYRPGEPPEFLLGQTFRPEDRFGAFFDVATIDGERIPVMGADQVTFFDRLKPDESGEKLTLEDFARQVRFFVLRYFLTLGEQRTQEQNSTQRGKLPFFLQDLSWYPKPRVEHEGFAFTKIACRATGELPYKFTPQERHQPIDVENLREKYDWLLLKTRLLDAALNLAPFGPGGAQLHLPMSEGSYLVLDRTLLQDESNPEPGVLGRYGIGYAMIHFRRGTWPFVYGPGQFNVGVQFNQFDVMKSGHCRVRQTFIVNQPKQVLSIFGFDPLMASISMANLMTLGFTGSRMGINRETVCRFILFEHSMMIYNQLVATLRAFRHDDWLTMERTGQLPPELAAERTPRR